MDSRRSAGPPSYVDAHGQLPDPEPGGIASPRSAVLEAHDRPDPALGYVHNYTPVHGARGRAPSPRQVAIIQFPYVDAYERLPDPITSLARPSHNGVDRKTIRPLDLRYRFLRFLEIWPGDLAFLRKTRGSIARAVLLVRGRGVPARMYSRLAKCL